MIRKGGKTGAEPGRYFGLVRITPGKERSKK
jgi:hypothetical protein